MKKKVFLDKSSGKKFSYLDIEEIKKRHPEGEFIVIGEIYKKEEENKRRLKRVMIGEENISFCKNGTYSESKYKTVGYISCGNNEYIAIKKKKNRLLWLLLLLLLLLMLLGGLWALLKGKLDLDPNAVDYESALKRPDNINDSQILIPGYGKFTIKQGSNVIDTVLFNPEGNPCFFQFTLVEKSTKKELFKSKLVAPGKGIAPVKINKVFKKTGSYDAVLKFKTVDLEDTKITYNGSDIEVKINVVK